MNISEAIRRRVSTRSFIDKPVSHDTIRAIIDTARWTPSGANIQPWRIVALTGEVKRELGETLMKAKSSGEEQRPDFAYYPDQWIEPYRSRRKECGLALYNALEIGRQDEEKMMEAWQANYRFFDAPVGLVFLIERKLAPGYLLDMGMFIQSVMLTALDMGLATCPQAAIAEYPDIVRSALNISDSYMVVLGMALGYVNKKAAVNSYRTERAPVEQLLEIQE